MQFRIFSNNKWTPQQQSHTHSTIINVSTLCCCSRHDDYWGSSRRVSFLTSQGAVNKLACAALASVNVAGDVDRLLHTSRKLSLTVSQNPHSKFYSVLLVIDFQSLPCCAGLFNKRWQMKQVCLLWLMERKSTLFSLLCSTLLRKQELLKFCG